MKDEFLSILKEAIKDIENIMAGEDRGWINLSKGFGTGGDILPSESRKLAVQKARYYATIDPLAKQSIRLWTDYTFGTGMTWAAKDESASEILSKFWNAPENGSIFSARGQRKCSDKLLIDGEIFFAIFIGSQGQAAVRTIDPLEITELVTNPDDIEDVRYYKRVWATTRAEPKDSYYRSFNNLKDKPETDILGKHITATEDAIIYHLAINTIGQRGNSMLTPVLDWIRLYRQFLGSRVAIMLALARFAWITKRKGGAASIAEAKGQIEGEKPAAGSWLIENLGSDTQPVRTDSGARNAYEDGRQIKLQIASGTGWPEQYYGDISIGNLATAKTVELPVTKMCQSYQAIWAGTYNDIMQLVLARNDIPENARYIDIDYPPITPADESELAKNIGAIGMVFPEFLSNRDVMQMALMSIGIKDTNEVIDEILGKGNQESNIVALTKALRQFRESLIEGAPGSGHFGHAGRPGEVGGSGEGGGVSPARETFIKDKIRVTGKKPFDQEGLGKVEAEIKSAKIPDSHLEVVEGIEINTAKVNAKGGMSVAMCDSRGHITLNGKVGAESTVHEIGHAYFQKKIYVPRNDDKYVVLDAFTASTKTGKGFPSFRARADTDEYFAESYAAYAKDSKAFSKMNPSMGKLLGKYWK